MAKARACYLATVIVEVVLLDIGVLALLGLIPLGQHATDAGAPWVNATGASCSRQTAPPTRLAKWSSGRLRFPLRPALPHPARPAVPVDFRACRLSGPGGRTIAELFGLPIGTMLSIPGMFFELVLPLWLFTKGLRPQPMGPGSVTA